MTEGKRRVLDAKWDYDDEELARDVCQRMQGASWWIGKYVLSVEQIPDTGLWAVFAEEVKR